MFNRSAAAMLVLAVIMTSTSSANSAEVEQQSLGRSLEKLKKEKKLTIGYFGGSITAGAGASDASKTSWRALTTAWFKQQYPEAAIKEINAAIGGTGSDLGAFRCPTDLLRQDPDLVFIEFAVNDEGKPEQRVRRSLEGIVRLIWTSNPWAEIVLVYTTARPLAGAYAKSVVPSAVGIHQSIAKHYGIPEINVGQALAGSIARGEGTWESLTTDGVHPNDAGYALYSKSIASFLETHRGDEAPEPLITLQDPLAKDPFSGAHFEDATTLFSPGWDKEEKSLAGHYPHFIATNQPGTELTHHFSGTTVGLFWLIAPDSGDLEWSIDDGEPKRISSWDKYALKFSRAGYVILTDELRSGEHTLKIRVLPDKNPQSQGTWIRIGAFLVHCDC